MSIAKNQIVTKQDVINYFNANIVDFAYSGTPWHSGNVPKIQSKQTGQTGTVDAIPASQFDSNTKNYLTSISDTIITASTLTTALLGIVKNLTRIRNTTYRYYHSTSGVDGLVATATNKAIFKAVTPVISGTTRPYYTKSPNVTDMTQNISVSTADISAGALISAEKMINFFNALKNSWQTAYNNTVTFTYYTCHDQCHSNCEHRARR